MTNEIDHILVLSMDTEKGKDRRSILNYDFKWVKSIEAPQEIKDKFSFRYNIKEKKKTAIENTFASHLNILKYIIDNKLNNVIVNEDDAFLDGDLNALKDLKEATLLGGTLRHPSNWAKDTNWRKVNNIKLKVGVNTIDYSKYRWTQIYSVYYPVWEEAKRIYDSVVGSDKYKHYDIFIAEKRLIKKLYYPSIFTHMDNIDKNKKYIKATSQIGSAQGIIKNYKILGKDKTTFNNYNPFSSYSQPKGRVS